MSPSLQTMGFFMSDINFCNTKEQLNHLGEVVTGKVDGSPSGPDIETSTLPYTGQVRKTLPALEEEYQADIDNFVQVSDQLIVDKTAEFNEAIQAAGGEALNGGVWAAGQTFTAYNQFMVYNDVPYKPLTTTTLPYGPTGATPDLASVGPYVQVTADDLNAAIKSTLSSSSALSGYNLVGTFENGAVLNSASDVISDGLDVWIYRRFDFPKTVAAGSSPTPEGEYNWKKLEIFPVIRNASDVAYQLIQGENLRLELYGDSTMWGSVSNNSSVQEVNHPGAILQNVMNILFSGTTTVVNNAIPGSSLRSMMRGIGPYPDPFDTVMANSTADVVFSNHCQNDMNNNAARVDQFIDDLKLFVTTVRKYGKVPVLVTPNTTFFDVGITELDTKRIKSFVDAIKFVASEMSVDVVDVYDYFIKTSKDISMSELVPDGVHPGTKAYGITGRNMAMPFVSAATLDTTDDSQGFSNISYSDDAANARVLQVSSSKFGNTLVYQSDGTLQRVQYPVILERATVNHSVALYGLQWPDGGTAAAMQDNTLSGDFAGIIDMYHPTATDWNGLFVPSICDMYAGLQVIGLIAGSAIDARNNKVGFSGVGLVKRSRILLPSPSESVDDEQAVLSGSTVKFKVSHDQTIGRDYLILSEPTNGNEWVILRAASNGVISLYVNGVQSANPAFKPSGVYDCSVKISTRNIEWDFGGDIRQFTTTHTPSKSAIVSDGGQVNSFSVEI